MSALAITSPYPQYFDLDGSPLDAGYIYIGKVGSNPETNPISVYWDKEQTQQAAQPLRTLNGYISRAGTPTKVFSSSGYSLSVRNKSRKLVLFSPSGEDGSVIDLLGQLASPKGGTLIGWIRDAADAVATTLYKWMGWQTPSFFEFMSDAEIADVRAGTKLRDVSAAVQKCINAYQGKKSVFKVRQPAGIYRCDEKIVIKKPINITGDGVSPHGVPNDGSPSGSIFYFNHTGRGIEVIGDGDGYMGAVLLQEMGTMRPQPALLPGWVPAPHDFDIYAESAHLELNDFTFVNPTKGLDFKSLGYGRMTLHNIKGQPLKVGVQVTASADVVRVTGVHFWPFWQNQDYVDDYTRKNLDAFVLARCDNPMFSEIFTIFARSGISFVENEFGTTSKMHLVNADFDRGMYGISVDETVKSGITAQMDNVTIQGESGLEGTANFVVSGDNSVLQIGNLYTNTAESNSVRVEGLNNRVSIGNYRAAQWNLSNENFPAVEVSAGNIVRINSIPTMFSSAGGDYFGGDGVIKCPLGDGSSTAPTDSNGDVLIAHGLGAKPSIVICQLRSTAALILVPKDLSSTNFTVRVYAASTGLALPNTAVSFAWEAAR